MPQLKDRERASEQNAQLQARRGRPPPPPRRASFRQLSIAQHLEPGRDPQRDYLEYNASISEESAKQEENAALLADLQSSRLQTSENEDLEELAGYESSEEIDRELDGCGFCSDDEEEAQEYKRPVYRQSHRRNRSYIGDFSSNTKVEQFRKMMPRKNVPKPGPAKLRPNSTPEEWLAEAKQCHYLPEAVMKQLCEMVKEHLMEESNIQPVCTPVVVCGDIHGQFYDLLELFRVAGGMPGETNVERPSTVITSDDIEPPTSLTDSKIGSNKDEDNKDEDEQESRGRPRTAGQSSRGGSSASGAKANEVSGNGCQNFIFLGDFVDRGYFSLETLTLLLCLKALYPDKITLVRGNHESRQITQVYGFYEECVQKYGNASVWKACCQVFDFLILAAIVDGQILCVHGGLSPEIRTLDQIRVVARAQEIPHEGAFCDLVWSDPDDIDTWGVSPRGAGWLFGEKVATEFNHVNGLKLIARAHQLVNEGYKYHFSSKNVVTVWSAPNYCYRCGNVASIMNVDENCDEKFNIFAAVPEDKRHVPSGRRTVSEYFL